MSAKTEPRLLVTPHRLAATNEWGEELNVSCSSEGFYVQMDAMENGELSSVHINKVQAKALHKWLGYRLGDMEKGS